MTTHVTWMEVALRLALTAAAGTVVGMNRGEHGRAAGLRTTLLVCLAASISMIQVNLLLDLRGKAWDSFIVMDLMRLPLGILSGMGFIGAGAILRKDDMVQGVTTAATLWFVTTMGLCFGGGQLALGLAALGLAVVVLTVLKEVEQRVMQERKGMVALKLAKEGPSQEEVTDQFEAKGLRIAAWRVVYSQEEQTREIELTVRWRRSARDLRPPELVEELAGRAGVLRIEWKG